MGPTKYSQDVLYEAASKLNKAKKVEVKLRKEPSNPKDSRAIAFECTVGSDRWDRIGYVISEALDSMHQAMQINSIVTVEFAWIRYITHMSRCDPGRYCGIKVARMGECPREGVRCSSTI